MGGLGSTTATIGNEVTNSKTATAEDKSAAAQKLAAKYGLTDPNPPPASPMLGDDLLRKAGIDSARRLASKQGRKSSFLTGPGGAMMEPIVSSKKASGKY